MIVIDSHAHWHPHYDLDELLYAAYQNLSQAASTFDATRDFSAVLFVAGIETHAPPFMLKPPLSRRWHFTSTAEKNTLLAQTSKGHQIVLVLGRQVVSAEGLEVLGYAPHRNVRGGLVADRIVANILAADGIAIIPWGFGKWMGRRKSVVVRLIETWGNTLSIGDNGGRSVLFFSPAIFETARKKGIRILPGSDPLPIAGESERVGTCGFCLEGLIDQDAPLSHIIQALNRPRNNVKPFVRHARPIEFIRKQAMLRWSKFRPASQ